MVADPDHIDTTSYRDEMLAQASPVLNRQVFEDFIKQILSARAGSGDGANYATVSDTHTNHRRRLSPPRP